jgi:ribosomal protein S27E
MKQNQNKDFVNEKDVKCPKCGGEMEKIHSSSPKTKFKCVNCGYTL